MRRVLAATATLAVLTACNQGDVKTLKDTKEKVSYSIGLNIGRNLKQQNAEVDPRVLAQGIKDAQAGTTPLLTDDQIRETMMAFQQEMMAKQQAKMQEGQAAAGPNAEEAKKFLEENGKKEGWKTTASGLQYKVVKEGKGASPTDKDTVTVHYRGTLPNGKEFDSSYKRNAPATFPVTGVIPGWTEALKLMKPGAKYELAIPPELAYGPRGAGQDIPPNAALLFEVELLGVNEAGKK
jgi:FKBP-type peptidyl-prolyl cis-trans isomerase FklB